MILILRNYANLRKNSKKDINNIISKNNKAYKFVSLCKLS